MAFGPSKRLKWRSTIILGSYPNQNGPTNFAEEPKSIQVRITEVSRLKIQLTISGAKEQIVVNAKPPLLQTEMAAFFFSRSSRVSPGLSPAPTVTTITLAVAQSSKSPACTKVVCAHGSAWLMSSASPSALLRSRLISTMSGANPDSNNAYAVVAPTLPTPTIATRSFDISLPPFLSVSWAAIELMA